MAVLSSKSSTVGSEQVARTGAIGVSRVRLRSTAATLSGMPPRIRIAAVALVLAVGGCSSGHAAAAPAPSPSKAPFHATQIQWASAMDGPVSNFQKTYGQYETNICQDDPATFTCAVLPIAISADAGTIVAVIEGCELSTSQVYIGPPPASMARLVQTTHDDAKVVEADTASTPVAATLESDLVALTSALDQWGPYLAG